MPGGWGPKEVPEAWPDGIVESTVDAVSGSSPVVESFAAMQPASVARTGAAKRERRGDLRMLNLHVSKG